MLQVQLRSILAQGAYSTHALNDVRARLMRADDPALTAAIAHLVLYANPNADPADAAAARAYADIACPYRLLHLVVQATADLRLADPVPVLRADIRSVHLPRACVADLSDIIDRFDALRADICFAHIYIYLGARHRHILP